MDSFCACWEKIRGQLVLWFLREVEDRLGALAQGACLCFIACLSMTSRIGKWFSIHFGLLSFEVIETIGFGLLPIGTILGPNTVVEQAGLVANIDPIVKDKNDGGLP